MGFVCNSRSGGGSDISFVGVVVFVVGVQVVEYGEGGVVVG